MNHTPTPWQLAGITTERLQGDQKSIEADFIHIEAEGYAAGGGIGLIHNKPNGVGMANAQFILTACNAHEELVKSLKEMTTILSAIQNTLTGYLTPDSTLDQDDCINAILNISDHKETLSKQRSALQLITAIEKGA